MFFGVFQPQQHPKDMCVGLSSPRGASGGSLGHRNASQKNPVVKLKLLEEKTDLSRTLPLSKKAGFNCFPFVVARKYDFKQLLCHEQEEKTGTSAPGRAVPAAKVGKKRAFREFTPLGVLLCERRFADIYRASHGGEAMALQGTWDRVPQSPSR